MPLKTLRKSCITPSTPLTTYSHPFLEQKRTMLCALPHALPQQNPTSSAPLALNSALLPKSDTIVSELLPPIMTLRTNALKHFPPLTVLPLRTALENVPRHSLCADARHFGSNAPRITVPRLAPQIRKVPSTQHCAHNVPSGHCPQIISLHPSKTDLVPCPPYTLTHSHTRTPTHSHTPNVD